MEPSASSGANEAFATGFITLDILATMNLKFYFWIYLALINLISALFFIYDKILASCKRERIREKLLHTFEALGGVYANLILMYLIRHKNKKIKYYKWTWLIFVLWFFLLLISLS